MANENRLQKKLNDLEEQIWKQHVTTKDKIKYGSVILGATILSTIVCISLWPLLLVAMYPLAIAGTVGAVIAAAVLSYGFIIGTVGITVAAMKKGMAIAINKVKNRCSDEINMSAIEKLSSQLEKEVATVKGAKELGFSSKIIDKSVTDMEWLVNSINKRYTNLKVKENDLNEAILNLGKELIVLKKLKTNDGTINNFEPSNLVNAISKLKVIARAYCSDKKILESPKDYDSNIYSNVQENNFNKPKEQEKDNIKTEPKKVVVPKEGPTQQNTPKKEGSEKDMGNNE